MGKMIGFLYGVVAYLVFFGSVLYMMAFVGNYEFAGIIGDYSVPKTIDSGAQGPLGITMVMDVGLLALFGVQHTVMARPMFKVWWTRIVPKSIERSTYVLVSSLLLILIFYYWQPIQLVFWDASGNFLGTVLEVLYWFGWALVFYSTFLIDHFDLFGLKQVLYNLRSKEMPSADFQVKSLYKIVRHPLMVGWIVVFWAAPVMTNGRLLFATTLTIYILIALIYEEKDLEDFFGEKYREYKAKVPKIMPFRKP
jgi:protein-S-isoprenylcysteine O-methyltransferase Ste14